MLMEENEEQPIRILSFRTSGCEGSFENSPMKVTKQDCVLPIPSHSYKF